jgi:hypothetical protein
MAVGKQEQEAILNLMHGKYERILVLEAEWGIRFDEGDMRPRIEHFHDAVRAYTSGEDMYSKHTRLSVEHLAYDLAMLRQIQERPVGNINRATEKSTGSALMKRMSGGAAPSKLPPQGVRQELVQHYRDYTVFFAALFAEVADRNFKARQEEGEQQLSDIGLVEHILEQLANGQMDVGTAQAELNHVEMDDLRERIQALLASKKLTACEKQEALSMLGAVEKGLKEEQKRVDASHTSYVTGQLAVYEDAKDIVKKLAGAGLNLAGKFLQNAIQNAGRGQGRGA